MTRTEAEKLVAKCRTKKTPRGRHLYYATVKGFGQYGWGNTPKDARAKLLANLTGEER